MTNPVSRVPLALAMIAGPLGLLTCNTAYSLATRNGGSDATGADALALAAAQPTLMWVAIHGAAIGALLMVPAALGTLHLIGDRARRLGFIAATLVAAGYICYFAVANLSTYPLAMADRGGPLADYAAVIDATQGPAMAWVFLLFVLGNLAGTFLLALALLRARAVPTWAAVAIMTWPPLHIAGLIAGSEWWEVTGAALQAAGFAAAAVTLLRTTAPRRATVTPEPVLAAH